MFFDFLVDLVVQVPLLGKGILIKLERVRGRAVVRRIATRLLAVVLHFLRVGAQLGESFERL